MKVRVLSTGQIKTAKYFKDITKEEIKNSVGVQSNFKPYSIFTEPYPRSNVWRYMYDSEVEILEEEGSKSMKDFKVRCVENISPYNQKSYTVGKCYEVKDGCIVDDTGSTNRSWSDRNIYPDSDGTIDSLNKWMDSCKIKFELVSDKPQFTKDMLKTGMRVETRNGNLYIVMKDLAEGRFIGETTGDSIYWYNQDLTNSQFSKFDIIKVYNIPFISEVFNFKKHGDLLWQRPEIPKMTHKEIESIVGHEFEYVKE